MTNERNPQSATIPIGRVMAVKINFRQKTGCCVAGRGTPFAITPAVRIASSTCQSWPTSISGCGVAWGAAEECSGAGD
jgi:hypothetical protein